MAHLRKHEAKQARCLLEPTISQRPTQELSENVRKLCKSSKDAVQRYDWNKPKDCDTTQIFTVSCASVNEETELKLLQLSQNRYLHCQLRKCWWRRKIASATTLPKSIQKWEPNTENLSQQNVSQQQLGSSFCLAQVFWLKFCLGSPAGLDWIRVWARLLGRCFFGSSYLKFFLACELKHKISAWRTILMVESGGCSQNSIFKSKDAEKIIRNFKFWKFIRNSNF